MYGLTADVSWRSWTVPALLLLQHLSSEQMLEQEVTGAKIEFLLTIFLKEYNVVFCLQCDSVAILK